MTVVAIVVGGLMMVAACFPMAWLFMLAAGNLGLGLSFWGALPAGVILTILAGAGAGGSVVR